MQIEGSMKKDAYCEVNGTTYMAPFKQISSSSSMNTSLSSITLSSAFQPTTTLVSASSISSVSAQRILLQVPFTSQAPFANWNPPFDEACEEASFLMIQAMFNGVNLTPSIVDRQITEFVNWQTHHSYAHDVSISTLALIIKEYAGFSTTIFTDQDVTIEKIESLIKAGYPVIIPAAGQLLQNPYFSGNGPPYHMLVITGFTESDFITNDPGTKRGAGYMYNKSHLVDVIHDWNGSVDTINTGPKAMLIVEPLITSGN